MLINVRVSELHSDTRNSLFLSFLVGIVLYSPLSLTLPSFVSKENVSRLANVFIEMIRIKLNLSTSDKWDGNIHPVTEISSIGNDIYSNSAMWLMVISVILLIAMLGTIVMTVSSTFNNSGSKWYFVGSYGKKSKNNELLKGTDLLLKWFIFYFLIIFGLLLVIYLIISYIVGFSPDSYLGAIAHVCISALISWKMTMSKRNTRDNHNLDYFKCRHFHYMNENEFNDDFVNGLTSKFFKNHRISLDYSRVDWLLQEKKVNSKKDNKPVNINMLVILLLLLSLVTWGGHNQDTLDILNISDRYILCFLPFISKFKFKFVPKQILTSFSKKFSHHFYKISWIFISPPRPYYFTTVCINNVLLSPSIWTTKAVLALVLCFTVQYNALC